jgi:hypothetical protein
MQVVVRCHPERLFGASDGLQFISETEMLLMRVKLTLYAAG